MEEAVCLISNKHRSGKFHCRFVKDALRMRIPDTVTMLLNKNPPQFVSAAGERQFCCYMLPILHVLPGTAA